MAKRAQPAATALPGARTALQQDECADGNTSAGCADGRDGPRITCPQRGALPPRTTAPLLPRPEAITTSLCRTGPREAEFSGHLRSLCHGRGCRPSLAPSAERLHERPPPPPPRPPGDGVRAPTAHAHTARACAPRRLPLF